MTDRAELIAHLTQLAENVRPFSACLQAADLLEADAAEIARLTLRIREIKGWFEVMRNKHTTEFTDAGGNAIEECCFDLLPEWPTFWLKEVEILLDGTKS